MLILTHEADVHADAVSAHLTAAHVDVFRLDTSTFGSDAASVTVTVDGAAVTGVLGRWNLDDIGVVWHRRPSEFTAPDPGDLAELRSGVGGVLAGLPYLNHPADMAVAGLKPYQLIVAARSGLTVPATLVTTDRVSAEAFAKDRDGEVVVKPMGRTGRRLVTRDDRTGWDRAVSLTQLRIEPDHHVRLTAVDHHLFAVRIDSPHLDWRHDLSACTYSPCSIPPAVRDSTRELLGVLRLRYAALDFVIDRPGGRWWFLEANPNGQWLWIEQATGLPISAAVAEALAATAHGRRS